MFRFPIFRKGHIATQADAGGLVARIGKLLHRLLGIRIHEGLHHVEEVDIAFHGEGKLPFGDGESALEGCGGVWVYGLEAQRVNGDNIILVGDISCRCAEMKLLPIVFGDVELEGIPRTLAT